MKRLSVVIHLAWNDDIAGPGHIILDTREWVSQACLWTLKEVLPHIGQKDFEGNCNRKNPVNETGKLPDTHLMMKKVMIKSQQSKVC